MKDKIELLKSLIEDENIKGKKLLKKVLWLNTSKPEFKVGDKVLFNDTQLSIYGNRCYGWKGVIIEVTTLINAMTYHYHIESICSLTGEKFNHYVLEENILTSISNGDMINNIDKKGVYSSSISI